MFVLCGVYSCRGVLSAYMSYSGRPKAFRLVFVVFLSTSNYVPTVFFKFFRIPYTLLMTPNALQSHTLIYLNKWQLNKHKQQAT